MWASLLAKEVKSPYTLSSHIFELDLNGCNMKFGSGSSEYYRLLTPFLDWPSHGILSLVCCANVLFAAWNTGNLRPKILRVLWRALQMQLGELPCCGVLIRGPGFLDVCFDLEFPDVYKVSNMYHISHLYRMFYRMLWNIVIKWDKALYFWSFLFGFFASPSCWFSFCWTISGLEYLQVYDHLQWQLQEVVQLFWGARIGIAVTEKCRKVLCCDWLAQLMSSFMS